MKYLSEVVSRTTFICALFYVPYAIFWQLPVAIGTYMQKNQYISQNCSKVGAVCQWAEGVMAMFIWGNILFIGLATVITIFKLLKFIVAGPKKIH